ncbi:hypothetical protein BGX29_011080 [Mortierella sp. GBA35]|nr:hypothetical protein BGX29_011080 [Mortierella sp. GBA35]
MAVDSKLRFIRTRPLTVLTILFSLVFITFYHGGHRQLLSVSQIGSKLLSGLSSQTAARLARSEVIYQRHVAARREYLTSRNANREGGLWTCGTSLHENQQQRQPSKPCIVYSMTKDTSTFSFEIDLIKRAGCEVWIFAPSLPSSVTMQLELKDNPKIHFVETAIGKSDRIARDGTPFMTLPTIMKDKGHSWVDFLKMDVEGAEYKLLDTWMEHFEVLPFSQLLTVVGSLEVAGLRSFWAEQDMSLEMLKDPALVKAKPIKFSHYSFINTRSKHLLLG